MKKAPRKPFPVDKVDSSNDEDSEGEESEGDSEEEGSTDEESEGEAAASASDPAPSKQNRGKRRQKAPARTPAKRRKKEKEEVQLFQGTREITYEEAAMLWVKVPVGGFTPGTARLARAPIQVASEATLNKIRSRILNIRRAMTKKSSEKKPRNAKDSGARKLEDSSKMYNTLQAQTE
eukprot:g5267.t1